MPFIPLRVPIALLHQKVYATSHRLPKWEAMELKKEEKKPDTELPVSAYNPFRLIELRSLNLFERVPYLRKFFLLMGDEKEPETVMCRACGEVCEDVTERTPHFRKCFSVVNKTITLLVKEGKCVICDAGITPGNVEAHFYGAPVCSEQCMNIWDYFAPEVFEFYLREGKE